MKKRFLTLLLVPILFCLSLCSCGAFVGKDGSFYYYDLNDARKSKSSYYENCDYLFTEETEDCVTDFIIKDNALHIVQMRVRYFGSNAGYRAVFSGTRSIEEEIYYFEELNDYYWTSLSKLSVKRISWCIVSEDFNSTHDNYPSFEFIYEGETYSLCYDMNN